MERSASILTTKSKAASHITLTLYQGSITLIIDLQFGHDSWRCWSRTNNGFYE